MAKYKVPSKAASGADTFSDNLVGNQITTGTGQLTNTNFALDSEVVQRDTKKFKTNPFSDFLTLDDLKKETESLSVDEIAKRKKEIRFKGGKNDAGKSLFGSLKNRLGVATKNIINKFPAGILIDSKSYISVSGLTATNISYNNLNKTTEFQVEYGMIYNSFGVRIVTPNSKDINKSINPIRDFYSSYKKYVLLVENKTYDIVSYTEPNVNNSIKLKVIGKPFTGTTYSLDLLLRPNDGIVEEFFKGLDDLEESLLNKETSPIYTASFKVPRDSFDQTKTELISVNYNWPTSTKDSWNIKIAGLEYDEYLRNLSDIANEIDDYKSNLFVRFLTSPQLFEFDSPDQKAEAIFQLYGQSFDNVKKYIDNIAYMRNVSYDGINNVPDVLLKNLANTLGLDTVNLIDEKGLDELLYTKTSQQYPGLVSGTSLLDAEFEFYRRLLVNLAYIYKSKGTRQSLEFFLRFLGAPEPMIKINQYVYKVTSLPKTTDLYTNVYNAVNGKNIIKTGVFLPTGGTINNVVYPYYSYYTGSTTGSTTLTLDNYPVNLTTLLPKGITGSTTHFFQKGSGWYDNTADHKSPMVIDTDLSSGTTLNGQFILTGRTKTVITKNSARTYGEDYFDLYRTLPGTDLGFGLESIIDNSQIESLNDNSGLILNRKNIQVYLSSAQAIDYDIYRKSRDLELSFGGNHQLLPQTGVTFAEYVNKVLHEQVKNSHTIKYKKNYITLEDIYRDYIIHTDFTPYTFPDVNLFIEKMSPYWTSVIDQIIPSTTLWTGGNLIENNIFARPKYQYKFGCQPKEFTEELYPNFELAIEEDLETLLGEENNLRGLIDLTGMTYYPVIEIDGTTYGGKDYQSGAHKIVIKDNVNTSNSAKLYDTWTLTGCTLNVSFPLICDYKEYVNPDIVKIKELWKTALTNLIDSINTGTTIYSPGYETYTPYLNATIGTTHATQTRPKLNYTYFTDIDGIEKIKFTSIKYGAHDCSVNEYFSYRFYSIPNVKSTSYLDIDFSVKCDVFDENTELCELVGDVIVKITGATHIGIQKNGITGYPVFVHYNCETLQQNLNNPSIVIKPTNEDVCTLIITGVTEVDDIDLMFTDAANSEMKVKVQGLQVKAIHDPLVRSHFQEFSVSSYKDVETTSILIDTQYGVTFCDNYTGWTITPKIQTRSSFNYGLKDNTTVLVYDGATKIKKLVSNLSIGDKLVCLTYPSPDWFSYQTYLNAKNNNDFSFTYDEVSKTITNIECLGSVKKSLIVARPHNGNPNGTNDETFEVLPTTRLRVFTNKEVDENTLEVTELKNHKFTNRLPEHIQIKLSEGIKPCCDHKPDLYLNGDYIINQNGGLMEVISVDLNYCDLSLYRNINVSGTTPSNLILLNGTNSTQLLLQHKYQQFIEVDIEQQQYYTDEYNCPTTPTIASLERNYGVVCNNTPIVPCGTVYTIPTPLPSPTPTSTTTSTPTPTPTTSPTPTPTSTSTPTPTPSPIPPTATATPTPTASSVPPTPTASPIPPTQTQTPTPSPTPNCEFNVDINVVTATPTPTPTSTSTSTPTPTPTSTSVPPTATPNCEFNVDVNIITSTPIPTSTPTSTPVPPTPTATPNCEFSVDINIISATPTPTSTPVPPTSTPVPPTHTPTPTPTPSSTPTSTPVPPTATPNCEFSVNVNVITATPTPTSTPVPPTSTPIPPTSTPIPPTSTPVPPTSTPVPPTSTPIPPTSTPVPPTSTPVPPTPTPTPTATTAPFYQIVNYSSNDATICYSPVGGFPMSGNGTTFCNSTTFTSTEWNTINGGTYYLNYGGNIIAVSHTPGYGYVTSYGGGCTACSTPTPTPTATPIPPTYTPTPTPTATGTPTPTPTSTPIPFGGTIYYGTTISSVCPYGSGSSGIVTGDGTTFCGSQYFTGNTFAYQSSGFYYMNYNGDVVQVALTYGSQVVDVMSACLSCPTPTPTPTSTPIPPTSTPVPPPTSTPIPPTSTPVPPPTATPLPTYNPVLLSSSSSGACDAKNNWNNVSV